MPFELSFKNVNRMIVDGTINTERFIEFLTRLIRDAARKVFLTAIQP